MRRSNGIAIAPKPSPIMQALAGMKFPEAAEYWLDNHQRYVSARTIHDYRAHLKRLNEFFGDITLREITIEQVRGYQDWRKQPRTYIHSHRKEPLVTKGAGNMNVNKELSTLQQVMNEAGLWAEVSRLYRALPISSKGSGRALTADEERRLIAAALNPEATKPRLLAGHCIRLMLRTGCGFGEIRNLRREDVDTDKRLIHIRDGAKNEQRVRTIPLTDDAMESILFIIYRWQRIGGHDYRSYILPSRAADGPTGETDFYKPMGSIKKAWGEIKNEAKIQGSYRIYDCRVTAVTKALSSGKVSVHTAKKLFGHVSEAMQRRYFKPDMDLLREAVTIMASEGLSPN
jgi:integrase